MLVRVRNCLSGFLAVWLGSLSTRGIAAPWPTAAAACGLGLAVASANIWNDIVDREVDALDQPWRPLAGGAIPLRQAIAATMVTSAGSLVFATMAAGWVGVWVAVIAVASLAYSAWLKSTVLIGNVLVAVLAVNPIVIGAVLNSTVDPELVIKCLTFTLFLLAFEIVKTARDVRGDAAGGLTTIATVHGTHTSLRLGSAVFAGSVLVSLSAVWYSVPALIFGFLYLVLVAVRIGLHYRRLDRREMLTAASAFDLFTAMQKVWRLGFLTFGLSILGELVR
jgi:4-hydroxybenzoate polyprenyltransferase